MPILLLLVLRPLIKPLILIGALYALTQAPGWLWTAYVNPDASQDTVVALNAGMIGLLFLLLVQAIFRKIFKKTRRRKKRNEQHETFPMVYGCPYCGKH